MNTERWNSTVAHAKRMAAEGRMTEALFQSMTKAMSEDDAAKFAEVIRYTIAHPVPRTDTARPADPRKECKGDWSLVWENVEPDEMFHDGDDLPSYKSKNWDYLADLIERKGIVLIEFAQPDKDIAWHLSLHDSDRCACKSCTEYRAMLAYEVE
jgi:hypothetical protein